MITQQDIIWAKNQCVLYYQWSASRRPQGSPYEGDGGWGTYFSWMNGYYHTMLKYLGGYNPKSVRNEVEHTYTHESKRLGGRRARHVWSVVLFNRGERIRLAPWTFSELQFEILSDEATNRSVFDEVERRLERHLTTEVERYARQRSLGREFLGQRTNTEAMFRNERGGTIDRQLLHRRNVSYSGVLVQTTPTR